MLGGDGLLTQVIKSSCLHIHAETGYMKLQDASETYLDHHILKKY